ncbi:MAG: 2-oxo acid dehydrogenase subunit E2 [Promethearchaeota archaeon]
MLKKLIKNNDTTKNIVPYPKMRNFILDIMHEGKKKNIVYANFEVEVTALMKLINALKEFNQSLDILSEKYHLSFTAYLSKCFADTLDENPKMQAYRKGRRKLVLFKNVDIAFMIEKNLKEFGADYYQPVNYIMRDANKKSLKEIQDELFMAKSQPVGGEYALNEVEDAFWCFPKIIRRLFWKLFKHNPNIWKLFIGTAGVTSVGMFGDGRISVFPITPMTITMAIGRTFNRVELDPKTNKLIEKSFVNITLGVDHDIIDGGPLMRFIAGLKSKVIENLELPYIKEIKEMVLDAPQNEPCINYAFLNK